MNFPLDWPANCPPLDAEPADGEVYRIVRNNPMQTIDAATHRETGRLPKATACLRCGLSVFSELRDVLHQRELFPKLGDFIAIANLAKKDGKMKLTQGRFPSHLTWWPYLEVDRVRLFTLVIEEE